jgi:hypothetical protein
MNSPFNASQQSAAALPADAIDRLLDEHFSQPSEPLVPSSGFVHSVMESIHAQASAPPPLVFPWRTLLAATLAFACVLLGSVVFVIRSGSNPEQTIEAALHPLLALTLTPDQIMLCWIYIATCLSAASIAASFRITGNNE